MKFRVEVGGEEQEIDVIRQGDRLRISYGDQVTEVRLVYTEDEHFVLEYEQTNGERIQRRRLRAAGHVDGDERQLWVNGSFLTYRRIRERAATAPPVGSLSASIPAVVSEILVAVGQAVSAGEKLVLLESMKMILPIQAPHDGVVSGIFCEEGEAVQPGAPLVEVEPD